MLQVLAEKETSLQEIRAQFKSATVADLAGNVGPTWARERVFVSDG